MALYRPTGNLVIRPCEVCCALVLHEEGEETQAASHDGEDLQPRRFRSFPHNAPGGAACIGGGAARLPRPLTVRAASAARRVRAPSSRPAAKSPLSD